MSIKEKREVGKREKRRLTVMQQAAFSKREVIVAKMHRMP